MRVDVLGPMGEVEGRTERGREGVWGRGSAGGVNEVWPVAELMEAQVAWWVLSGTAIRLFEDKAAIRQERKSPVLFSPCRMSGEYTNSVSICEYFVPGRGGGFPIHTTGNEWL